MKKQVIGRILIVLVFVLGGIGLVNIIGKEFAAKELEKLRIYIDPSGMTLESRVNPPEGYTRLPAEAGSFTDFLRSYPMKEDGAKILRYDGSLERNQNLHIAVFAMPVGSENLQHCADSVMRIYAEYCRENGLSDRLEFHFTNGFLAQYRKWRDGYRISVSGDEVVWTDSASSDDSDQTFWEYMRMVFTYAGTLSMETYETEQISLEELQVGDIFLQGGSPGHVVMVVDICENENGEKAFLLGQGSMPAQEFHLMKNPANKYDPWYYVDEVVYPFETAGYTFTEGSLRRLSYINWFDESGN